MFVVCSVGNFGVSYCGLAFGFIAASIKLEYEVANVGRYLTRTKCRDKLEGGGTIKVMTVDNSPADLTVGMSME